MFFVSLQVHLSLTIDKKKSVNPFQQQMIDIIFCTFEKEVNVNGMLSSIYANEKAFGIMISNAYGDWFQERMSLRILCHISQMYGSQNV